MRGEVTGRARGLGAVGMAVGLGRMRALTRLCGGSNDDFD